MRFAIVLVVTVLFGCAAAPAVDYYAGIYHGSEGMNSWIYSVSKATGGGWKLRISTPAEAQVTAQNGEREAPLYSVRTSQLIQAEGLNANMASCLATDKLPGEGEYAMLPYFALCRVPPGTLVKLAKPIPPGKEMRIQSGYILIFGMMGVADGAEGAPIR